MNTYSSQIWRESIGHEQHAAKITNMAIMYRSRSGGSGSVGWPSAAEIEGGPDAAIQGLAQRHEDALGTFGRTMSHGYGTSGLRSATDDRRGDASGQELPRTFYITRAGADGESSSSSYGRAAVMTPPLPRALPLNTHTQTHMHTHMHR